MESWCVMAGSPTATVLEHAVYFDRRDALAHLAFTVVAFVLRFYSPIEPDFFLHPFQGPIISNCVSSTPIDAQGTPGTLCGLAYPFNRAYPNGNGQLSPPNGQVFDEIYFPAFAHTHFTNVQSHPRGLYCPYFDPDPPLSKLIIGAGAWG